MEKNPTTELPWTFPGIIGNRLDKRSITDHLWVQDIFPGLL